MYLASDFHLGAPAGRASREREYKILRWLEQVQDDAAHIVLVGDIFDFWYEFSRVIPKGFVRFQGKIAELTDGGLPISFFTGNHDLWMRDYFIEELGVMIYHEPQSVLWNQTKLLIGHGDGLGPGDKAYKLMKKLIFDNRFLQFCFRQLHPDWGLWFAHTWSARRKKKSPAPSFKDKTQEWIWAYCESIAQSQPHDYYIFGHRHLPLNLPVSSGGRYINLGEWMSQCCYATFDGQHITLECFEAQTPIIRV
ncbi:MAG: UDP-2,3-diacylglucosamine diphosphatase [Bernardetiaceae bacterium]|nr:UDP-2,3-diacylglucosamine diphosphatase [Bernardetiaceae bacterium]